MIASATLGGVHTMIEQDFPGTLVSLRLKNGHVEALYRDGTTSDGGTFDTVPVPVSDAAKAGALHYIEAYARSYAVLLLDGVEQAPDAVIPLAADGTSTLKFAVQCMVLGQPDPECEQDDVLLETDKLVTISALEGKLSDPGNRFEFTLGPETRKGDVKLTVDAGPLLRQTVKIKVR